MAKNKGKKKSRSTTSKRRGPIPLKTKLTKSQLVKHLVEATGEEKKMVVSTLDALADVMQRSIMPGGVGEFKLPKLLKISLKTKKAIKKGTMVRSPAAGEMVPSKGRPESKSVKIRPLAGLKKAAAGEA